jgi:hypothetical protein
MISLSCYNGFMSNNQKLQKDNLTDLASQLAKPSSSIPTQSSRNFSNIKNDLRELNQFIGGQNLSQPLKPNQVRDANGRIIELVLN